MSVDRDAARETLRAMWDSDSEAWAARWAPAFREFAEEVVRRAALTEGERVLDVGTGTGNALRAAAQRVGPSGRVVGVDHSRSMVARARATMAAAGLSANVLEMDATSLDFPDGWFDAVISSCGLPAIGFDESAREILRVLKPGGRLVLAEWCLDKVAALRIFTDVLGKHTTKAPSPSLARMRRALSFNDEAGSKLYEIEGYEEALRSAGFSTVEAHVNSHTLRSFTLDAFLEARLARALARAEWAEMDAHTRDAFRTEARTRLSHLVHDGTLEILWPIYYLRATK